MRFDDRFLEEIKSRLRLSDVIGRTVKLRRQGREFVGLSPFTKERTPSFFVNDDKGFFHDFSSGKHGDLISFLQETERLSFVEAVEKLATEAGVALPAEDPGAEAARRVERGLADILELAAAWFEAELRRPAGASARAYLEGRGFPSAEWSRFRIGYAPAARTSLRDYLVAKGADVRRVVEAGLLVTPEDRSAPFDRFRDRVMFPISDGRGRILSFGGRALDPAARAKYLNGPETALFHKGRTLYGVAEARRLLASSPQDAPLVVVEGYMDAIACHRAGVAAVAPLGTALTEEQMEAVWRLHPEPTLCFDSDAAGRRAADRAIDRALPLLKPGRTFRFSLTRGGKDPDDVLREQGPQALRDQVGTAEPFVSALFRREAEATPLETPEQRTALRGRLRAAAARVGDGELAAAYREDLLSRLGNAAPPRRAAPAQRFSPGARDFRGRPAYLDLPLTDEARAQSQRLRASPEPVPAALARAALDAPGWLDPHLEVFESRGFGDPALGELAREIIRLRLNSDTLDSSSLKRHLAGRGYGALLGEIDRAASRSGAPFLMPDTAPETARSQWTYAFQLVARMAALSDAIESAKRDLAGRESMEAIEKMKTERDLLRREVGSGAIWTGGAQ